MVIEKAGAASDAPPPAYYNLNSHPPPRLASASSSTDSGLASLKLPQVPPPIAHCNLLNIERPCNKIDAPFVVNPDIVMAEELLASMSEQETEAGRRCNLRLSSAHGAIKTDVWVLDSASQKGETWLVFDAAHSTSDVRLHATGNLPCRLEFNSKHSTCKLQLPLDWQGMITIHRKHGSVSPLPMHNVTTISEVDGILKCFVGDIALLRGQSWQGNSLTVNVTHGTLKLRFGPDVRQLEAASSSKKLSKGDKKGTKWSWWPSVGFVDKD